MPDRYPASPSSTAKTAIALLHLRVVAHKAFLAGATREQVDATIDEALARVPKDDA